MGVIIFNGRSSKDCRIEVETPPKYSVPRREYEVVHVPGRNGDLIHDNKSYENVTAEYEVSIAVPDHASYPHTMAKVEEWLHQESGYLRLEDSYDDDCYRMAYYDEENQIENFMNKAGKFTITFNCKPGRWLKGGEKVVHIGTSGQVLVNPTEYNSDPLIQVHGSGNGYFHFGNYVVIINTITDGMIIDSDLMDVYALSGDEIINLNGDVEFEPVDEFPKLSPGSNAIYFSGGIRSLDIVPRWWKL